MSEFKNFERKVVGYLLRGHLASEQVEAVLDSASLISCENTGLGYFLTVHHSGLPAKRVVCSEPTVSGRVGDYHCGFIVFLENHELMLECHSWGADVLPEDLRDRAVEVNCAA